MRGLESVAALLGACLVLGGCADPAARSEAAGRPGGSPTPASVRPTGTPSATPSDTALPPAVQGLEPCPTAPDRRFVLRRGGERISGYRRGSGDRVVILSHQSRGTPCDLAALGAVLAEEGYRVVAWTADPGPGPAGLRLLVAEERRRGADFVALVGASLGAATSVVAAGRVEPPVDAVVALSPSSQSERNGDVAKGAARFGGPLMVVAAEHDPSFVDLPPELAAVHDGPELVEVVDGSSDHGKDFVRRRTDPMVERVIRFLRG
jgi:hypothetical protein